MLDALSSPALLCVWRSIGTAHGACHLHHVHTLHCRLLKTSGGQAPHALLRLPPAICSLEHVGVCYVQPCQPSQGRLREVVARCGPWLLRCQPLLQAMPSEPGQLLAGTCSSQSVICLRGEVLPAPRWQHHREVAAHMPATREQRACAMEMSSLRRSEAVRARSAARRVGPAPLAASAATRGTMSDRWGPSAAASTAATRRRTCQAASPTCC